MEKSEQSIDKLKVENELLLQELEDSYKNTLKLLEQSSREKDIAYHELEKKFRALEELYQELSDKRKMLIHLDKLSSIGQFIVEIIHELKNPLSVISANTQLLEMTNPSEEMKQKIEKISKSTDRMEDYLSRFRRMIYNESKNFKEFDLEQNLSEFMETVELIKPVDIKIISNIHSDEIQIKGDPYQVQQIFFNLAKNAFDAMDGPDQELKIDLLKVDSETLRENGYIDAHKCRSEKDWSVILSKFDHFAIIKFSDNGSGMNEENMLNIFKPFYTTKSNDTGTGLGLSISGDIIKSHEGNIVVKSTPGKGSVFQIILPVINN